MVQTQDLPASPGERRISELNSISLKLHTKILLRFGSGPKNEKELLDFRRIIVNRFEWRDALKYVTEADTRFLNKARGLLAFNGLTLTALKSGEFSLPYWLHWLLDLGIILSILSAFILLLTQIRISFGSSWREGYTDDKSDFECYLLLIIERAKWISICSILSLVSLSPFFAAVAVAIWKRFLQLWCSLN